MLPRRAFAAGYIDESTAWELMEAAADAPYRVYDSWGSYVRDNLAGRNAWAGRRHDWMDQHVLRWWSPEMRDESPWQSVPWRAGRLPARPERPGHARRRRAVNAPDDRGRTPDDDLERAADVVSLYRRTMTDDFVADARGSPTRCPCCTGSRARAV